MNGYENVSQEPAPLPPPTGQEALALRGLTKVYGQSAAVDRVDLDIPAGSVCTLTVTGHGLKDPQWALRNADGEDIQPTVVGTATEEVATALGLQA